MARQKIDKLDKVIQHSFGATRRELMLLGKGNSKAGWRFLKQKFEAMKASEISRISNLDLE